MHTSFSFRIWTLTTAEISRAQIWQWLKHNAKTIDNKKITNEYYNQLLKEELKNIQLKVGKENYNKGKFKEASEIFNSMSISDNFEEFLTLPAYKLL